MTLFSSKMPAVLVEVSFSYLSLADLLKTSRTSKLCKKCTENVLARVTDLSVVAFLPSSTIRWMTRDELFAFLLRFPSLQTLASPGDEPQFKSFSEHLTQAQRLAVHKHLPHLQRLLLTFQDWRTLYQQKNIYLTPEPDLCPGLRSFPVYDLLSPIQLDWLDKCCPLLDSFTVSSAMLRAKQDLLHIVSRCHDLTLIGITAQFEKQLQDILISAVLLDSLSIRSCDKTVELLGHFGMEKLAHKLTSLSVESADSFAPITSVQWPVLHTFHCGEAFGPADLLDQLVKCMPALTDLEFDFYRMYDDSQHPESCCLSAASVSFLASHLRVLSLQQMQERGVDLLVQLSSCGCVLESLTCDHMGEIRVPGPIIQALSKMEHLTRLDVTVQDDMGNFDDPGNPDADAFAMGLCARSDSCNAQLRSVKLQPCLTKQAEDELVRMLVRVRPVLEVLSMDLSDASQALLRDAKKEERAKGSCRLPLYDAPIAAASSSAASPAAASVEEEFGGFSL